MTADSTILRKMIGHALHGTGAHAETQNVFTAFDWKRAGIRPSNAPHSVYELLNHMLYWQDWVVKWLEGASPSLPKHAAGGWPGRTAPESRKEWDTAVRRFRDGLKVLSATSGKADLLSKARAKTRLEMLQTIASHNSYHSGQVVVLRQLLDSWPPPSGSLTW